MRFRTKVQTVEDEKEWRRKPFHREIFEGGKVPFDGDLSPEGGRNRTKGTKGYSIYLIYKIDEKFGNFIISIGKSSTVVWEKIFPPPNFLLLLRVVYTERTVMITVSFPCEFQRP